MEGFADIEGPVRIGLMALLGWVGLLILLSAALIFRFAYWWKKRPRQAGPLVVERSPLEIALDRLKTLQSNAMEMEPDPFVVEVSDIVRYYLENSLAIPALEQTSEEFLQALNSRRDVPGVLNQYMPRFLEQCDRVKFARQLLAHSQREELLDTAGSVVRETDAGLHPVEQAAREVKS